MAATLDRELAVARDAVATVSATPDEQKALVGMEALLQQASTQRCLRLIAATGEEIEMPMLIFRLLQQVVPQLRAGHALALLPLHTEVTTQAAADLLRVSRPFLVGLLERGEIPFRMTGKHRRIRVSDLMRYVRQRDATRRQMPDRLTALCQEFGLDKYQD
jgi:excisionase family DNA binding protein